MVAQLQAYWGLHYHFGMRLLAGLITFALTLSAQLTPIFLTSPWRALQAYLALSEGQIALILTESSRYYAVLRAATVRRELLEQEILTATRRSPLSPDELGRLHFEWETVRRTVAEAEQTRSLAARAVLSESQLIQLRALEEVAGRREVIGQVHAIGLLPTDCCDLWPGQTETVCQGPYIPFVTSIPDWGARAEDDDAQVPAYPRLAKYLGLTKAQFESILEDRRRLFPGKEIDRMRTVVAEIRQETARETLDSNALGLRYAEVEALRRKFSEDQRAAEARSVAALTPAQKLRLDALKEALGLYGEIEEARSADFLGTSCRDRAYAFLDGSISPGFEVFFTYLGDCPDKRALNELP